MSKPTPLNKRQGGSYTKDPETGESTLIEQTKHQEITGFENVGSISVVQEVKSPAKKALAK
jgi:hypothetical protein